MKRKDFVKKISQIEEVIELAEEYDLHKDITSLYKALDTCHQIVEVYDDLSLWLKPEQQEEA